MNKNINKRSIMSLIRREKVYRQWNYVPLYTLDGEDYYHTVMMNENGDTSGPY